MERTFCAALGSYRRGKLESGDIDMLVCLPPSLAHEDCAACLQEVCRRCWVWLGLPAAADFLRLPLAQHQLLLTAATIASIR